MNSSRFMSPNRFDQKNSRKTCLHGLVDEVMPPRLVWHNSFWRKGFTLIELLVVVGIIALLMVILLPALNKAKEYGRKAACASNQRQLVNIAAFYHSDYDCLLPGALYEVGYGPSDSVDNYHISWPLLIFGAGYLNRSLLIIKDTRWTELNDSDYRSKLPWLCPSGMIPRPDDARLASITTKMKRSLSITPTYNVSWLPTEYRQHPIDIMMSKVTTLFPNASTYADITGQPRTRRPIRAIKTNASTTLLFSEGTPWIFPFSSIQNFYKTQPTWTPSNQYWYQFLSVRIPHLNSTNYACLDGHVDSILVNNIYPINAISYTNSNFPKMCDELGFYIP